MRSATMRFKKRPESETDASVLLLNVRLDHLTFRSMSHVRLGSKKKKVATHKDVGHNDRDG